MTNTEPRSRLDEIEARMNTVFIPGGLRADLRYLLNVARAAEELLIPSKHLTERQRCWDDLRAALESK